MLNIPTCRIPALVCNPRAHRQHLACSDLFCLPSFQRILQMNALCFKSAELSDVCYSPMNVLPTADLFPHILLALLALSITFCIPQGILNKLHAQDPHCMPVRLNLLSPCSFHAQGPCSMPFNLHLMRHCSSCDASGKHFLSAR